MSDNGERLRHLESTEYMLTYAGNPNGLLDAAQASLCYDTTTGNVYVNLDGAVSWALIGGGGGGGAPNSASYLVLGLNAGLTSERRFDPAARFAVVDGGPNADYDIDLAATGVGAGAYGSATQVGAFTVDAYGRLTLAANVAISGVPPSAHSLLGDVYHGDTVTQGATRGSLIYGNATPLWDELVLGGISGSVLTRNATDALWSAGSLSFAGAFTLTIPASGTAALGTGTTGYVAYWNGTNTITGEAQLFYDAGNNRLGINDATPSYTLDVNGIIGINDAQTIYNVGAIDSANFYHTMYIGEGGVSLSHIGASDAKYVTAVGWSALLDNTTGYENTAVGASALQSNSTGYRNTAVGYSSLIGNIDGNYNAAAGYSAMAGNTSGSYCAAFGASALGGNTTGTYNTAIGYVAGRLNSDGTTNQNCTHSVFVGNDSRPSAATETNQIVIGSISRGNGSNTTTIGVSATTDFYAFGNHVIVDGNYIGNGAATARTVYDSSGAQDYIQLLGAYVGVNTTAPTELFQVDKGILSTRYSSDTTRINRIYVAAAAATSHARCAVFAYNLKSDDTLDLTTNRGARVVIDTDGNTLFVSSDTGAGARTITENMRILGNGGNVGIGGIAAPASRLDIGAGALTMSEMVAPGAPAANGGVIYLEDNGAGKTRLMVLFATGAAQQIAIQP